jgi:hypothetical protein
VGDVVEFEREGDTCKGVVFTDSIGSLVITRYTIKNGHSCFGTVDGNLKTVYKDIRKTGTSSLDLDGLSCTIASDKAKAYFAQEQEIEEVAEHLTGSDESKYKVGQLVEVVRRSMNAACVAGDVVLVVECGCGNPVVRDKEGVTWFVEPDSFRPLSGTYAERQAKFIDFYDLKVGSKVKVVRKFDCGEGGNNARSWDSCRDKAAMQGGTFEFRNSSDTSVCLWTADKGDWWCFPYFALEPVK